MGAGYGKVYGKVIGDTAQDEREMCNAELFVEFVEGFSVG